VQKNRKYIVKSSEKAWKSRVLGRSVGGGTYQIHMGCIEIMDNCFLGSESIILPGVMIGPNAVVAAGAVVTKDVSEGSIVGGNLAKVIGKLEDLLDKRKNEINVSNDKYARTADLWKEFNEKHFGSEEN